MKESIKALIATFISGIIGIYLGAFLNIKVV